MAYKQSPNLVASGAMGIVTGLAIAGGLLFALSLPAMAEGRSEAQPVAPSAQLADAALPVTAVLQRTTMTEQDVDTLRTFGNSTARSRALAARPASSQRLANHQRGELVALSHSTSMLSGPRS